MSASDSREWTVISQTPGNEFSLRQISTETRTAAPTVNMPYSIYSSLKYSQKLQLQRNNEENTGLVVAHLKVIFPDTNEEVLRAEKRIIEGNVEATLKASSDNILEGSFRWKFTECSYHFGKRHFAFDIYFYTAENLQDPFMVVRSAPFMVYARKPSTPQSGRKRRKTEEHLMDQTSPPPPNKLPRTGMESNAMSGGGGSGITSDELLNQFKNKLFELVQLRNKMDPESQQAAVAMVIQQFQFAPFQHLQSQFQLPPIGLPTSLESSVPSGYTAQMTSPNNGTNTTAATPTNAPTGNTNENHSKNDNNENNENNENEIHQNDNDNNNNQQQQKQKQKNNNKTDSYQQKHNTNNNNKEEKHTTSSSASEVSKENSTSSSTNPHSPTIDVGQVQSTNSSVAEAISQNETFGVRRN